MLSNVYGEGIWVPLSFYFSKFTITAIYRVLFMTGLICRIENLPDYPSDLSFHTSESPTE